MDLRIGGVLELLEQNVVAGVRAVDLLRFGNRALYAQRAFRKHQFGAERRQNLAPLQ